MTKEEMETLKASVDAAKAKKAEEAQNQEVEAELLKEAEELGIDVSAYKKEDKPEAKKPQSAEDAEEKQSKTEDKSDNSELITKAAEQIAAKVSEAITKSTEEDDPKVVEQAKIYM